MIVSEKVHGSAPRSGTNRRSRRLVLASVVTAAVLGATGAPALAAAKPAKGPGTQVGGPHFAGTDTGRKMA